MGRLLSVQDVIMLLCGDAVSAGGCCGGGVWRGSDCENKPKLFPLQATTLESQ